MWLKKLTELGSNNKKGMRMKEEDAEIDDAFEFLARLRHDELSVVVGASRKNVKMDFYL